MSVDNNRTATVVVADDCEDIREMLKSVLEGKGFSVFEAMDGQEAIDLAKLSFPM